MEGQAGYSGRHRVGLPVTAVLAADAPTVTFPVVVDGGPPELGRAMGKGLAWSLLNNAVGRLGNFLSGIAIVRILSPEDYGTYAVGMVVLSVLLSMNELGVSVAIVQRKGRIDDIAPTVATLSIASSLILAGGAFIAAPYVASTLDAPAATGLIRLLLVGVVIDGIVSVPNALITRAFQQRKRLTIDLVAFLVGTPLTIGLAIAGYGAWSLGWGAVVGNLVSGVLAVVLAPAHFRPGWRRDVVRELLDFGLPLAGASFLLFVMLNVDYVIVGHTLGSVALGFYLLAFNLCSWPITVISTAIRRITLAAFARMHEDHDDGGRNGFERTVALVMALTLPICVLLGAYSHPVIEFLYGARWTPAADAVRLLAVLSIGRIAVELTYDYLAAVGRTKSSLWLHGIWLAALVPALTIGAKIDGITGVAAGHAIVVGVVVVPTLGVLLSRAGVSLFSTLKTMLPAVIGAGLIVVTAAATLRLISGSLVQLAVGVTVGLAVYAVAVAPMRHIVRAMWNLPSGGSGPKTDPISPPTNATKVPVVADALP